MAMDDDTGWTQVLVDGWGPLVRSAVVDRVERAMAGRRGALVRALVEQPASGGYVACVEEVHERIVAAVRTETGADLDHLGSQAAWACYDEVWGQLQARWVPEGRLVAVRADVAAEVVALIRSLSVAAAERAGADVGSIPYAPLVLDGMVRVDVDGLLAHLAGDGQTADRALIGRLVALAHGAPPP